MCNLPRSWEASRECHAERRDVARLCLWDSGLATAGVGAISEEELDGLLEGQLGRIGSQQE